MKINYHHRLDGWIVSCKSGTWEPSNVDDTKTSRDQGPEVIA